jgi:hypothetical protein
MGKHHNSRCIIIVEFNFPYQPVNWTFVMPLQDPAQQDCLTIEHDGAVTRIVFDNPKRKNAINLASWRRLAELT